MTEKTSISFPTLFEVRQAEEVFRTAYQTERADNSQNLAIRLALAAVWAAGRKYQEEGGEDHGDGRQEDLPAAL